MILQTCTKPGSTSQPNEDWVHAETSLLVVVDGATSRAETGCTHGVAWFAENLGLQLVSIARNRPQNLKQALSEAISSVAALHPKCNPEHPGTPSALGLARWNNDNIEMLVLADIAIAIELTDGKIQILTDERVSSSAKRERSEAIALPIGHPDRPTKLKAMKTTQQQARNQPGGFFVASNKPSVSKEAITKTIPAQDIAALAIISDGAYRAAEGFGLSSWPDVMNTLKHLGPETVIDAVRQAEQTDPEAIRWPRTKLSDDASIAYHRQP